MTLLRTLALLALAGSLSPTPRIAAQVSAAPSQPALLELGEPGTAPAQTASIFALGEVPIGDPRWSLRGFSLVGGTEQTFPVEPDEEEPSRTPEPAGLCLLGTGAFATALSIRYRLFAL